MSNSYDYEWQRDLNAPGGYTYRKVDLEQVIQQLLPQMQTSQLPLPLSMQGNYLTYADARHIRIAAGTHVSIRGVEFRVEEDDLLVDIGANLLDFSSIENGTDYVVFLMWDANDHINLYVTPFDNVGPYIDGGDAVMLGGFHTLCASVVYTHDIEINGGATMPHPLYGMLAGDILPHSVWNINHRPKCVPQGMVYIPPMDGWCDIYLQSGIGMRTASIYGAGITLGRDYSDTVEDMFMVGKRLLYDEEFSAAMAGSNEATPAYEFVSRSGGNKDIHGRSMISRYGVEDGCGAHYQWLASTSAGGATGTVVSTVLDPGPTLRYVTIASNGAKHLQSPLPNSSKGRFKGVCACIMAGGSESDGDACGSRARFATHSRGAALPDVTGRGWCPSLVPAIITYYMPQWYYMTQW